jgi:hypothetical protein
VDLIEYFFPVYRDILGRVDTNANRIALDIHDRDRHVGSDPDALAVTSCQMQHG